MSVTWLSDDEALAFSREAMAARDVAAMGVALTWAVNRIARADSDIRELVGLWTCPSHKRFHWDEVAPEVRDCAEERLRATDALFGVSETHRTTEEE